MFLTIELSKEAGEGIIVCDLVVGSLSHSDDYVCVCLCTHCKRVK